MAIHKGNELNNVNETWRQNEQNRENEAAPQRLNTGSSNVDEDLQNDIKEGAAEYDKANKEDRLLGGDRATVNDNTNNR
ncbi:MAG TPA: hypothetical protein VGN63_05250 [Flavisolibacter sp.]|jgi:hypothetical protein|nr:hypothetical protein [Flavisolibacter sp.]